MSKIVSSQQVNWFDSVYLFVKPWLDAVGHWPMVGTPAWSDLPEDNPAKWASVLDAAQHWALRVEACQEALCEASRAISAAADWSDWSRQWRRQRDFRKEHPWARRVVE